MENFFLDLVHEVLSRHVFDIFSSFLNYNESDGDLPFFSLKICSYGTRVSKRWWKGWKDKNRLSWEGFSFLRKLKNLKEKIKFWNKEEFMNTTSKKAGILEKIKALGKLAAEGTISEQQKGNYQT